MAGGDYVSAKVAVGEFSRDSILRAEAVIEIVLNATATVVSRATNCVEPEMGERF